MRPENVFFFLGYLYLISNGMCIKFGLAEAHVVERARVQCVFACSRACPCPVRICLFGWHFWYVDNPRAKDWHFVHLLCGIPGPVNRNTVTSLFRIRTDDSVTLENSLTRRDLTSASSTQSTFFFLRPSQRFEIDIVVLLTSLGRFWIFQCLSFFHVWILVIFSCLSFFHVWIHIVIFFMFYWLSLNPESPLFSSTAFFEIKKNMIFYPTFWGLVFSITPSIPLSRIIRSAI